jgi:hypothetical protein
MNHDTREKPMTVDTQRFPWAESLQPKLLASPWWIGHIPFAFELIGRLRPTSIVELGTYSGSSFAAFCQALEAAKVQGRCYGVDLWEGDIHMGRFDDSLYQGIADYVAKNHPHTGVLVRKDFNVASADFSPGSIDLLHIDGTHTYEAVGNDFHTWRSKLSDRSVVMFHDINVTVENVGQPALKFGVRRLFDEVKGAYPHFEFAHCYGLGVLLTGTNVPAEVRELADLCGDPEVQAYFAKKGGEVSRRFEALGIAQPAHSPYGGQLPGVGLLKRAVRKLGRISRQLVRP